MRNAFLCIVLFCLPISGGYAEGLDRETCLKRAIPSPDPAPVDEETLLKSLKKLQTVEGKSLIHYTEDFRNEILEVFDPSRVRTKTEQFYRMLYVLSNHVDPQLPLLTELDPEPVREILVQTKMFQTTDMPEQIQGIKIDRTQSDDPRYAVEFQKEITKMPLNDGEGFYAYTHGRCQKTTSLIFYRNFSFSLRKLENGNLLARYFRGVDFYGDFGTRGVIDLDFNYVSIKSVEFFKGTKVGEVTAGISPMEFKKNDHTFLLRIITKFVKNSSTQPLGW